MKILRTATAVSLVATLLVGGSAVAANAATKQPQCLSTTVNAVFTDSIGNIFTCNPQIVTSYTTQYVVVRENVTTTKMVTRTKLEQYVEIVSGKRVTKTRRVIYQVPVTTVKAVSRKVPTSVKQTKTTYVWSLTTPFIPSTAPTTPSNNVDLPGQPTELVLGGRGASSQGGSESFGGCFAVKPPVTIGSGILAYEVGYSKDGGKTWKFVPASPTVNPAEPGRCELEFAVHGSLAPAVLVAVRAVSKEGPGPLSDAQFFMGTSL